MGKSSKFSKCLEACRIIVVSEAMKWCLVCLTDLFVVHCSKFVDEKRVFTDIEFFLPQIAHLIIHLEPNSRNETLELLAMVIAQTSVHAALQLLFAFSSAMEDYQPEVAGGQANPQSHPFYFSRCARLCTDVERAVVYGGNEMSNREIDLLRNRMSPGNEVVSMSNHGHDGDEESDDEMTDQKRRDITQRTPNPSSSEDQLSGLLFFKRTARKSSLHSKSWKQRYFVVDHRVLICFREPNMVSPLRAIALQNCQVNLVESEKYGSTGFDVVNTASGAKYQLRAETAESRQRWVDFINK
jgi:phosphatidylinositol 4-kinase